MQPILVTTTCDEKGGAENIGRTVLAKRLAACVQVIGPVDSLYWWEARISSTQEYRIEMKSEKSLYPELSQLIRSIHPYEVPEIIEIEISQVDNDYARWLKTELDLED